MDINQIISKLNTDTPLYQETNDKTQLDPASRLESIYNVTKALDDFMKLDIKSAIDLWSGFGYGVIILDHIWIRTIGCENVQIKHNQAQRLFENFNLKWIDKMDFTQTPAIINQDFLDISIKPRSIDLITSFYTSEYFFLPEYLKKYKEVLSKNWKVLFSTDVDM